MRNWSHPTIATHEESAAFSPSSCPPNPAEINTPRSLNCVHDSSAYFDAKSTASYAHTSTTFTRSPQCSPLDVPIAPRALASPYFQMLALPLNPTCPTHGTILPLSLTPRTPRKGSPVLRLGAAGGPGSLKTQVEDISRGEVMAQLKDAINSMVDNLSRFADDVARVSLKSGRKANSEDLLTAWWCTSTDYRGDASDVRGWKHWEIGRSGGCEGCRSDDLI
ncbi:hypothetical protein DL96DRAFT_1822567 [Flagelloscypha sp. PMI_526]|nr:hypothetical protein DL96DRAFT_1822567 [Flagelloscypha sp. PMI_526]